MHAMILDSFPVNLNPVEAYFGKHNILQRFVVPEGVKMVLPGESIFIVETPEVFCEGIRVHQFVILIREEVITEWESAI